MTLNNVLWCQEIGSPELKLRWQFQLYDCDRSGEGVRLISDHDDDNIEMISQEISTKKNLWKSFSRSSKEKKRKSRSRRKKVLPLFLFQYNCKITEGRKERPLLRELKRCLPSWTTVETERCPRRSLLRAACRMKIWSECCRKTEFFHFLTF